MQYLKVYMVCNCYNFLMGIIIYGYKNYLSG